MPTRFVEGFYLVCDIIQLADQLFHLWRLHGNVPQECFTLI